MAATLAKDAQTIQVKHFPGCPVPEHPDNADLQARVETYRVQKNGLRLNHDGLLEAPWITVAHCCECGELTYHEER
jgi:hypothetical protein